MQHVSDGFRIASRGLATAFPVGSDAAREVVPGEGPDSAERTVGDVLGTCRGRTCETLTPIDPLAVARLLRATATASRSHPLVMRVTGNPLAGLREHDAADVVAFMRHDILARGHGLELLRYQGATLDRGGRRRLGELMAAGARVRLLASDPPAVVTVGTRLALLRTAAGPDGPETLLVRGSRVAGVLRRIQLTLWEQASELPPARGQDVAPLVLDAVQSEVLHKLCAGMKDETAARQMNVSVRTYRRHVATILRSLDVSSRFEAGLRVAELGLPGATRSTRPYGVA